MVGFGASILGALFVSNATYNSLRNQVAYCKMQGYNTTSRNTSDGPSMFTSGAVYIGAGLSALQFGSGLACGMCFEVLGAKNLALGPRDAKDELRGPFIVSNLNESLIGMVFDECTDPICQAPGFLDFDMYSPTPPVSSGNPREVVWRAVPCPVHGASGEVEHHLEYLFCFPGTCNAQDSAATGRRFIDVFDPSFLSLTVRNSRVPVVSVRLLGRELKAVHGAGFVGEFHDVMHSSKSPQDHAFTLELRGVDGSVATETLDWGDVMSAEALPQYHGGVLLRGRTQL